MIFIFLAELSTVHAATLTVGPSDYPSIQSAIDAASSQDTISISSGSYAECLDLGGKDLSLEGSGSVTIDGSACNSTQSICPTCP